MKKQYVRISRIPVLLGFLVIGLVGLLVALFPAVMHATIEAEVTTQALGPCFFCKNCGNQSSKNILDPEMYSGYSVIVDTVWIKRVKKLNPEYKKSETMMVNGKEYILR